MVVETRASSKSKEKEGMTVAVREEHPSALSGPLASSATAPLAPSRPASIATSRSSATRMARRLAAEALHARRIADLEGEAAMRDLAAQREAAARELAAQREVADLELRAELAAIELDASQRDSNDSRASVQDWLANNVVPSTSAHILKQNLISGPKAGSTAVPKDNSNEVPQLVKALGVLIDNVNKKSRPATVLPNFDGKSHLEWLSFKRIYQNTEDSHTAIENIARLSAALRGAARESVAALLVSAREPGVVLRALDTRFGRPELVVLQEVTAVRALPKVSGEGKDLAVFACRVRNCVEVVRLLNQADYLRSPELFHALFSKIPLLLRTRWLDYAAHHEASGLSKLEMFADFLAHEVDLQSKFGIILEHTTVPSTSHAAVDSRRVRVHSISEDRQSKQNFVSQNKHSSAEKHNISCILCQQEHSLNHCDKFSSLTIDERWQLIKKKKVCHRCLKVGWHRLNYCKAKSFCGIDGCTFRHHALLHNPNYERTAAAHVDVEETELAEENEAAQTATPVNASSSYARAATDAVHNDQVNEILTHASTSFTNESASNTQPSSRPLLKVVAVTVSGPLGSIDTYTLLDDGSTATFIDAEITSKLGISGPERQIHLDCVGGLGKEAKVQYVDFHIKGCHSSEVHLIRRARSISGLGAARQSVYKQSVSKYPHLVDIVDKFCYDDVKPMIIIGIDNWHLTISRATRKGTKTQPVAIQTALGWVLFGFGCSATSPVEVVNHTSVHEPAVGMHNDRSELENLIKEQYKLESIGISKREKRSADDERAVEVLERTARRLPSGRFEVGLLWKSNNVFVPDSYKLALSRFLNLEKKMRQDLIFAEKYRQNINDIIRKDYAELCTEPNLASAPVWYLPHFGVVNPNKPGKLRVVHDAAAKTQNISLNSLLLTGPDILQPLLGILLRFREGKVALTADIREMFPQLKIRKDDRDAQRFLWRNYPNEPIKTYRMASMIFGAASSPFTALYIKNKNATEFQDRYPDAAHAIIFDHYMDDYIGSMETTEQAARLAADVYTVHKKVGFEMRGWISNKPEALSLLPKESLKEPSVVEANVDVDLGSLVTPVRTLGLIWQPDKDYIGFNTGFKDEQTLPVKLTKREVLAHVMRIYDPLGILAPIVVRGRIMFQNAWRKGLDWDEELSQSECAAWKLWFEDLFFVSKLQIPRRYCLSDLEIDRCELHLFSDASELAYVAVAFWRFVLANGDVKLALICSKARVAPLKPVSVPRLELQGALIAARLASSICEAHRFKVTTRVFWCDSMTVLGWLRSDARSFKPFVSHRVGEILELSDVKEWRWVPSILNVADDATRIKRSVLTPKSRWILGPEFLLSSDWPCEPCDMMPLGQEELKPSSRITVHFVSDEEKHTPISADPKRFSSWLRLVRATAIAHKYITLLRMRSRRGLDVAHLVHLEGSICTFTFKPENELSCLCSSLSQSRAVTANNLRLAETHIFLQSQLNSFSDEKARLLRKQPLPRSSRLFKISPIIGDDGMLRLSSRISAVSGVREETKHPIILDGRHPAVRLLVERYHQKAAHVNTETVVNELRQQYFILSLRSTVRSVTFNCQTCRLRKAVAFQPPIGDLPEARLAHHQRPFSFVGLDYFGPVLVSIGRRREKRWIALYTCLVVRAVHLEIVNSLSADAAIMSLRRFIARRGTPTELWSDNGTSFVGANRELRALYAAAFSQYAANEKINWRFIPPAAPFMGGAWERLVKSVKIALKATLKDRAPSEELLRTLLAEAEALVNTRPLTHVPPEPGSEEALTPMHFLIGASSGRPIPAELSEADLVSRSSWRRAVRLSDHFWQRWVKEYLPTLAPRRGQGVIPNIVVGDLVLVADGNLPRGTWPRGRVTATFSGKDNIIRVADVATATGVMRRPVKKLVPVQC